MSSSLWYDFYELLSFHFNKAISVFILSLQPQNLLYSPVGVLKVADFGLARCFVRGQRLRGKIGTLTLMAPEILRGRNYEGPPIDVWATGVVLHFMFTKKYPFSKKELRVSIYTFPLIMIFYHYHH